MVANKQVVIEGDVAMVALKSMGVTGAEIGSGAAWKVRLGCKELSAINDWPLGARVHITVELLDSP